MHFWKIDKDDIEKLLIGDNLEKSFLHYLSITDENNVNRIIKLFYTEVTLNEKCKN